MKIKYNGILIRPFRQLYCGLIIGHRWKNISPVELQYVCQECIYCWKERIV